MGARPRAPRRAINSSALRLGREHLLRAIVVELGRVFAAAAQVVYEDASRQSKPRTDLQESQIGARCFAYRDPEKALEHANKAYRLGGGVNADCAFILAAAYAENNDAKNAVNFCNIAIRQQPDAKTQNEWEQIKVLFNVNKKVKNLYIAS